MASPHFITPRLAAHRLSAGDFATFRAIHTDVLTMQTLSADGSIPSEEMSRAIFDRHLKHWDEHDYGLWLLSLTASGESVGYCGLRRMTLRGVAEVELFFGLHSRFFRQGLGTEIAHAVLEMGFREIRTASVIGFTLSTNRASRALMTKLGMTYEGPMEHAGLPHQLYRLTRSSP